MRMSSNKYMSRILMYVIDEAGMNAMTSVTLNVHSHNLQGHVFRMMTFSRLL